MATLQSQAASDRVDDTPIVWDPVAFSVADVGGEGVRTVNDVVAHCGWTLYRRFTYIMQWWAAFLVQTCFFSPAGDIVRDERVLTSHASLRKLCSFVSTFSLRNTCIIDRGKGYLFMCDDFFYPSPPHTPPQPRFPELAL